MQLVHAEASGLTTIQAENAVSMLLVGKFIKKTRQCLCLQIADKHCLATRQEPFLQHSYLIFLQPCDIGYHQIFHSLLF